jgi:hypothetical protein
LEGRQLDFDDMDYDEAVEIIEKQNDDLLFEFQEWLLGKGLSKSTVIKHTNSIELPDWIEAMEKYMSPDFEFEDWLLMSEE